MGNYSTYLVVSSIYIVLNCIDIIDLNENDIIILIALYVDTVTHADVFVVIVRINMCKIQIIDTVIIRCGNIETS